MKNLGTATVKVQITQTLPNIDKGPKKINFDLSAHNAEAIKASPIFPPFLTEVISDGETFAAMHPSKRKLYVNNYMASSTASSTTTSQGNGELRAFVGN